MSCAIEVSLRVLETEVSMSEDEPKPVLIFVEWIYSGKIRSFQGIKPEQLWVLGNRLLAPEFYNVVIK
jgi:hypothetical protein